MDKAAAIDGQAGGAAEPAPWRLRLAGLPQLLPPQGPALALDRHGALIAARLVLAGPQPRELLARLLWPDVEAGRARGNLRQRLLRLKSLAGFDWIHGEAVLSLAQSVQPLLPQGGDDDTAELLAGVHAEDSEELGAWLEQMRAEHRARQLKRLLGLAAEAEAGHRLDDALAAAQRLLALEPHAEEHHRLSMRLHYLNHDFAAARAAYERLRLMLQREYAAAPSAATRELLALIESATAGPGLAAALPGARAAAMSAALARPPRLVGREAEAAALLVQLARRGTVLLAGEGGIGKSRLLAEVCGVPQGQVLGLKVIGARPGDAGVPYALAGRWLRSLLQRRGAPPAEALRPDLARVLPELGPSPGGAGDFALLVRAVQGLVADAATHGVLAHLFDDLQYADDASVELLQALAGPPPALDAPPAEPACGWLFALRPAELGPAAAALVQAQAADAATLALTLQPLDAAAVRTLLDSLALEGIGGERDAQALLQRTGGNPLYLLELLKARLASVRSGAASPTPWPQASNVSRLIQARLARLSPLALKVARCAALAGADMGVPLIAHVLHVQVLDLADAWAELQAAQVLGAQGFSHDLVAEAARDSVPPSIATALHADIAAWLEAHEGEPAGLAGHWLAAGLPRRAVPHLQRAAGRARALGQYAEAARWHEQAAAILLEAGDRQAAFDGYFQAAADGTELADHALVERCHRRLQELAEGDGPLAMAALVEVALLVERDHRFDLAWAAVLQALPRAQRAGLVDMEVELLWDLTVLCSDGQRVPEALGYAEQALARLPEVDPATARMPLRGTRLKLAMAAGQLSYVLGRGEQGRARLQEARRIALEERQFEHAASAARALTAEALDRGDSEAARRWVVAAEDNLAQIHGLHSDRGAVPSMRELVMAAAGDLGAALAAGGQSVQEAGTDRYATGYRIQHLMLLFQIGRPDLAIGGLRAITDAEVQMPIMRALHQAALLAVGEPGDAAFVLAQAAATSDLTLRSRLLGMVQSAAAPPTLLPLLEASTQAALARGASGLWLDLQIARLAALREAGAATEARQAVALAAWEQVEAGIVGRELFPRLAGELCQALTGQPALAQVIAMQASAWMLRAASTLEPTPRRIYLTQAPVLKLFGRGLLALPGI